MKKLKKQESGSQSKDGAKNSPFVPLYTRQPHSDNYTNPNFLADMELNPSTNLYSIQDTIARSTRIAFQISASILFYVMYHNLCNGALLPNLLLRGCWTVSFLGHLVYQIYVNWPIPFNFSGVQLMFPKERLRVTLVYIIFSYALAPILRTLTATISTDTIHASSAFLIVLHLITNDYGVQGFFVSKTISMNAAVIGAICLASRLPTDTHSLALLTMAVLSFILFPLFSTILWDSSVCLTVLVITVSYACSTVSTNIFLVYILLIFFITGILPFVFVVSQKFKYNLYGPWDEAVVTASSTTYDDPT